MAKPQQEGTSNDRWGSLPIACAEGLVLNMDALTQGTAHPGSARILQNFECALEGGYRRINGYQKWDTATVPGTANTVILGVKAALGGVVAVRHNNTGPTNDIFFSTGSGWGSRINTANRPGNAAKARMVTYAIASPTVAGVDGKNHAWKWDGTTYTLLNGAGSPTDPKYIEFFNTSLALAGYSSNPNAVTLSAPGNDADYSGAGGAAEINVGNPVTAIKCFRNTLYVFCTNAIYKITGTDTSTWELSPVTTQIGCIASDTVQEIAGDLIYLAPDGFRSVAGTYNIGDVDLSLQSRSIQPFIRTIITNISDQNYSSCVIRKKSQYRCFFYDPSVSKDETFGVIGKIEQGSPLQAFNYVYTTYAWSTTLGIQAYCADSYFDNGVEHVIMGDPTNGYVYLLESGNDFDGTDIPAIYQSPYLTFQDATLRKVMQKLNVYTSFEGTNTISLDVNFDFNNTGILQPASVNLANVGSYPVFGSAVYDTDFYSGTQFPIFRQNLIGSGFTTAFAYSSTGGASYTISSYQITYAQKGRR